MSNIVEEILQESQNNYKSIEVTKNLELDIDVGNLLAVDNNVIDLKLYRANTDEFLKDLARDNAQILINKLWELPHERCEDAIVVKLPAPTVLVPREKRIPQAAPLTKWQQYAKDKGIQHRKKSKKVWDEVAKDWKPRWGFKRGDDETKDWLIEVPVNADPYEDQFEKRKSQKKERVAKNEFQRLRNIARASKVKVPKVGLAPTNNPSKEEVTKALALAKVSTASIGKFQENLPKEKPPKKMGKKRKFDPLFSDSKTEKQKNLAILKNIGSKKPKLDVERAINTEMLNDDLEKRKFKGGGKSKRSKDGNKKRRPGQNRGGKKVGGKKSFKGKK